jgi:transcriptional regulator MraZ
MGIDTHDIPRYTIYTHGRVRPTGGTSAASIGRPLPSVRGRALGEEVALFMSTYVNKVDRKGRVSVPATFRAQIQISGQSFLGVVTYPLLDQEALEGTSIDRMQAISAALDALDAAQEQQDLATMIFGQSQQLAFDPEGRILLPEPFVAHTHITESAVFVGLGLTFQIWEPGRFAAHRAALLERARRQGTRLPPLGSLGVRPRQ